MKHVLGVVALVLAFQARALAGEAKHELVMTVDDKFVVADSGNRTVEVERYLMLRFADLRVSPTKGRSFSLMLYFHCDTPDIAQYDTPKKIETSVRTSSEKYLSDTVEKHVTLKQFDRKDTYGYYVVLTDRKLAGLKDLPEGKFKYLTRGMIRVSKDSALGFSLMTNELDGPEYKELLDSVLAFIKPGTARPDDK